MPAKSEPLPAPAFQGTLDAFQGGVVNGWAHMPTADDAKVHVWLNGRLIRVCSLDVPRPDVAALFGPQLLRSGFSVDISGELSRAAVTGSAAKIEVAATIDRAGERHLENSPLVMTGRSGALRSVHYQFPGRLRAEFQHGDAAAAFVGHGDVMLEIDGLSTTIVFAAASGVPLFGGTASSLELSRPLLRGGDLAAAIEMLASSRRTGGTRFEAMLRTDDSSATARTAIPVDELLSLMVPMAVAGDGSGGMPPEVRARADVLASTALDLVEQDAAGLAEPLVSALQTVIAGGGDAEMVSTWARVLLGLWDRGCWSLYAQAIEPLLRSPVAVECLAAPYHSVVLPLLWNRAVKIISGRLAPEAESAPFVAAVENVWDAVSADIASRLRSRDPVMVEIDWARTLIVPCLNVLAKHREMLHFLLGVELETACLRISSGNSAGFNRIGAGNLLIEPFFQHVERLYTAVSLRFPAEVVALFHGELQSCFVPGTFLRAMVTALGDPTAKVVREDALEQMAADVLICGSESRRCNYGRLQAIGRMAMFFDTWRDAWHQENQNRSHLYSFESTLKNRPRVVMVHGDATLKESMHQISEDLSPLVDTEGAAAFSPGDVVVFDGVDIASAAEKGRLVLALASAIGPAGQRGQTVIFAPWLSLGGADAYCAAMANAVTARTGIAPVVCLTESGNTDGAMRLHPQVRVVDLSAVLAGHSPDQQAHALAMAISMVRPATVFNFNSRTLWSALAKFYRRLTGETRYGCMFFCDDLDGDGVPHSYLRQHAHLFSTGSMWAIADSVDYFGRVAQELSIAPSHAVGVRFPPARVVAVAPSKTDYGARRSVLWCGRFDRQKRLDILLTLARSLPDVTFHVYGFPMLESNAGLIRSLQECPNVKKRGRYKSFSEIDVDEHDCLLLTTQWEGIPNVLLEAGIRGLPVVAPLVGGIPETLGTDRGYAVSRYDSPHAYAEALRACIDDRDVAAGMAKRLREYIRACHGEMGLGDALGRLGYPSCS